MIQVLNAAVFGASCPEFTRFVYISNLSSRMPQGKTKVKTKVPDLKAKQKKKNSAAFTRRHSKFLIVSGRFSPCGHNYVPLPSIYPRCTDPGEEGQVPGGAEDQADDQ